MNKINYSVEEVISKEKLDLKIIELSQSIRNDYKNSKSLIFVGILRGSLMFIADLLRNVNLINATVDFMFISSYGKEFYSSGNVKINKDLEENIEGKDVIIVEDIIDTGLTIHSVVNLLKQRNPKSLKICCLLSKPNKRIIDYDIDYLGFIIDDYFVVGYGIDYAQKYRSLPYIGKIVVNKD